MNNALDIKVDPDVAARLIEHLRHDTTDLADADLFVPITHFTDPRRAQAEIALMKTLPLFIAHESELRSEERRVGKACVSTCRSRWSPDHSKKKKRIIASVIQKAKQKKYSNMTLILKQS